MKFPEQDVAALVNAVNIAGRSFEAQAEIELQALALYDYSFYQRIKEKDGPAKAAEVHKRVWLKHVEDYLNETDTGCCAADWSVLTLGEALRGALERRGCVVSMASPESSTIELHVTRDALKEYAVKFFQQKPGGDYLTSLGEAQEAVIRDVVAQSGAADTVGVTVRSTMWAADGDTKIVLKEKG